MAFGTKASNKISLCSKTLSMSFKFKLSKRSRNSVKMFHQLCYFFVRIGQFAPKLVGASCKITSSAVMKECAEIFETDFVLPCHQWLCFGKHLRKAFATSLHITFLRTVVLSTNTFPKFAKSKNVTSTFEHLTNAEGNNFFAKI